MAFNDKAFMKQGFEPRTEKVPVPTLAKWFGGKAKAEWEIRSLTGTEVVKSQDAISRNKNMSALVEAITSNIQADKVKVVKELIGDTDKVPGELARRIEMLTAGSIEPKIDMSVAVKLAENFPVEFMSITNKIITLTGLGSDMVKPKPSGKTKK